MKISRSYLLGLGSGLILSALLSLLLSGSEIPFFNSAITPKEPDMAKVETKVPTPAESKGVSQQEPKISEQTEPKATTQPETKNVVPNQSPSAETKAANSAISQPAVTTQNPTPTVPTATPKTIFIPEISTSESIADILFKEQLIRSRQEFLNACERRNLARRLKDGKFVIPVGATPDDILTILTK